MVCRSYSVIIPTRERCDTLIATLKSVTNQNYDKLQIIVSDNFSQDETKDVVRDADDPRILYINPGKRLSMSKHWDFALSHASGDWLTIIGDDDALLPECLTRVNELADTTAVSMIRSSVCQYLWPNFNESGFATLSIPKQAGFAVRNCREHLSKSLHGWDGYRSLPMIYNGGFVERQVMSSASKNGNFYYSSIPDVYSAVVLSCTLDNYLFCHEPLAINGASKHSTGASQFSTTTHANSPVNLFRSEGNIPFHSSIPMTDDDRYPSSISALLYESLAQVTELLPDAPQIAPEVQLQVILATARKDRKKILPWAQKFARQHNLNFEKELALSTLRSVGYSLQRKYNRLRACKEMRINGKDHHIPDSYQASLVASDILSRNYKEPQFAAA